MTFHPKEPAKAIGQQARHQYLAHARYVIGEEISYPTLYHRFAQNDWAALQLDHAVAAAALKSGQTPKETVNMLHQGPYIQYQVHVNHVPVLAMSQYARGVVLRALHYLQKDPCTQA